MSNGWTDPTNFVDAIREIQKTLDRVLRGSTSVSAAFNERDLASALDGIVAPVIYRTPTEPVAGASDGTGGTYPDPLPSNAIWFDTDDGNRVKVRNPLNTAWVEADQVLTGVTLQTNPEPYVGLKFADNGLVAYGPDGPDAGSDGDVTFFIDATTGSLIAVGGVFVGGEISGAIVTGGLLRTSDTGKRFEIDGPGDIIRIYSGVAGEIPGAIDPNSLFGTGAVEFRPGSDPTYTQPSKTQMWSTGPTGRGGWSTTASYMYLGSPSAHMEMPSNGNILLIADLVVVDTDLKVTGDINADGTVTGAFLYAGNGVGASSVPAYFTPGGALSRTPPPSTREAKQDFEPLTLEQARTLLEVEPTFFRYKTGPEEHPTLGVIAEQAEEVGAEHWIRRDEEGQPNGFRYDEVPPALMLLMRDMQEQVSTLKEEVARLSSLVEQQ